MTAPYLSLRNLLSEDTSVFTLERNLLSVLNAPYLSLRNPLSKHTIVVTQERNLTSVMNAPYLSPINLISKIIFVSTQEKPFKLNEYHHLPVCVRQFEQISTFEAKLIKYLWAADTV